MLNADHKISFSPEAARIGVFGDSLAQRRWSDGRRFAVQQQDDQPLRSYSLPLRWDWQIDADSSLAVKLNIEHSRLDIDALRTEDWSDAPIQQHSDGEKREMRNRFLTLDFNTEFSGGHEITAGAKFIRNEQGASYADFIDGQPDFSLAVLGPASASRIDRRELFAQDEWRVDRTLALNLGASVEQRIYEFNEGHVRSEDRFIMWSPSAHLSKKIGGNSKRQVRLSLAQSFHAPSADQMLLHPTVNPFASCQSGQLCGANTIDTADNSGNPSLQPERSLGLNLSYTHDVGRDSELTLEYYSRDIHNKIGSDLELENVAWASAPRYVYRPANLGEARVRGVNLEGRLSGKDIWKRAPNVELHGSVGWAHSELSDLPGPDNRLMEQTPWSAKFGGSYAMQVAPLKLGLESSYLPGDWARNNLRERVYQSNRFTLGANASWKVSPNARLAVNLDNLLRRTNMRIDEYRSEAEVLQQSIRSSGYSRITIRLETKL